MRIELKEKSELEIIPGIELVSELQSSNLSGNGYWKIQVQGTYDRLKLKSLSLVHKIQLTWLSCAGRKAIGMTAGFEKIILLTQYIPLLFW